MYKLMYRVRTMTAPNIFAFWGEKMEDGTVIEYTYETEEAVIIRVTSTNKETGINSEVLTVRSLIGVDPYGMSLRKTSDAGVSLFIFEQYYGKVCEYSIKV